MSYLIVSDSDELGEILQTFDRNVRRVADGYLVRCSADSVEDLLNLENVVQVVKN